MLYQITATCPRDPHAQPRVVMVVSTDQVKPRTWDLMQCYGVVSVLVVGFL